jgi:hypothetical protein
MAISIHSSLGVGGAMATPGFRCVTPKRACRGVEMPIDGVPEDAVVGAVEK